MELLGSLFAVLLLAGAGCGLQWTEKLRGKEGPIQICSGLNLQLFWNFTLNSEERLKGIVWGCQPDEEEEGILATYMDGHFVPMSSFSGRLAHLQNGGIELSCTTILESGNYSITVSTEDANNDLTVYRKTVPVNIVDKPKTQTGEIHVIREEKAVRDVTTGAWHVQLSCGNLSDRGHPPVDVIWTTPKGAQLTSTDYQDGFFHLLIPNPPVGGNYTCTIPASQPAARCLDRDSPLLDTVCVDVEEIAGRFLVLEARQQEFVDSLKMERARQQEFEDSLKAERDVCMDAIDQMGNRTEALEQWRDDAVRNSVSVSFHARLTTDTKLTNLDILKLPKVISNQGEVYSPTTGYFTAPVNGTYFFMGTTGSHSSSYYADMLLMKEGTEVARTRLHMQGSYYNMGSCHAALYLTAGEKVWLVSTGTSYFSSTVTSFSGFRTW